VIGPTAGPAGCRADVGPDGEDLAGEHSPRLGGARPARGVGADLLSILLPGRVDGSAHGAFLLAEQVMTDSGTAGCPVRTATGNNPFVESTTFSNGERVIP
jgi:hypothetical protein